MAADERAQEIRDLETRFWNAMQAKDGNTAAQMTDDGCIIVGAQGVSAINASSMEKMTEGGAWELKHYEFDDKTMQVRFISDDIAITGYAVKESIVVDGATLSISANDASVWVRRSGEWRCVLHTESLSGDPFGRDRKQS